MKKMMLVLIASVCCSALATHAFAQDADKAIADAVIATVKAQWAADIKDPTNIAAQSKDTSDDYTEFNADYATRIDGKAMSMRLAEAGAKGSDRRIAAEMGNPKVQVYNGDVAILTYNYVGLTHGQGRKDGTEPGKNHARFCEKGRQMDVGPRKLCVGSAATLRPGKSERGAAIERFAFLAAPYLVLHFNGCRLP